MLERTMARLIHVQMKFAISEYVRLHFFVSSQAIRRSAVLASFEAMPSTEQTRGVKSRRWLRHAVSYLSFFSFV